MDTKEPYNILPEKGIYCDKCDCSCDDFMGGYEFCNAVAYWNKSVDKRAELETFTLCKICFEELIDQFGIKTYRTEFNG